MQEGQSSYLGLLDPLWGSINFLFKACIFCKLFGKDGGDAVMIISQANDSNVQHQPHIYQELPAGEIAKSRCEQFIDLRNGTMGKKMGLSSLGYEAS